MSYANFDRKLKDVGRLRQILEVLLKNELGFFIEALRLKRFMPLSRTMDSTKFIHKDTQPYRIVKVMEELGGTFVKLGQLLSIRPDLVPKEYTDAFSTLQDQVPAFPYSQVKAIVEKELGKKLKDVFLSFDPVPVAAASIGQVHIAKLKDGKKVAVKIQRPGIDKLFKTDIDMMYLFVYLFQKYHPQDVVNIKEIVEEFEEYTVKEMSYSNEAKNIDAFFKNPSDNTSTKIPKVYFDYSTDKVLTMEYVEGRKLSELLKSKKLFNRKLIARNIVDSVLSQVFVNGVFHADPHPGNILIMPNYNIAWLDFGIVGYFSEDLKEKATDIFVSVIEGDVEMLSTSLMNVGVVEDGADIEVFKEDLHKNLNRFYGAEIKDINIGELFQEILNLAKKHHLKLPKDFILLGKTIITTQGVAMELDPTFNLVAVAKPFVEKLIRQRNSPKKIFGKVMKSAIQFKEFIAEMPKQANELVLRIRQTEKIGEKLDSDMQNMTAEIDRSSNRIALGLLITAFLISSAIIWSFNQPQAFGLPLFSIIGIAIAFVLFFILTFSIAKEKF